MVLKISVTQAIISQQEPGKALWEKIGGKALQWASHLGLWASMGLFILAMCLIMYPFREGIFQMGRWVMAQSRMLF